MSQADLHPCESCGMPIPNGTYCQYCAPNGTLQPFDERFERMVQFQLRTKAGLDRATAEAQTREYMRRMPAWKDHPKLRS